MPTLNDDGNNLVRLGVFALFTPLLILSYTYVTGVVPHLDLETTPTGFSDQSYGVDTDWSSEGTLSVDMATDSDLIYPETSTVVNAFNVSTASPVRIQDVDPQSQNPNGYDISDDGTISFLADEGGTVYSYRLTDSWEVDSSVLSDQFDTGFSDLEDVEVGKEGLSMYVTNDGSDNTIYQYDLSEAYNVSTASLEEQYEVSGEDFTPRGIAFNTGGSKFYLAGSADNNIYEYDLSTDFSISSASLNSTLNVSAQGDLIRDVAWSSDGSYLYLLESTNDLVHQYDPVDNYRVSGAVEVETFDISDEDVSPEDLAWRADGTNMYMAGSSDDDVYQYRVGSETGQIANGTWRGSLRDVDLVRDVSFSGIGDARDGSGEYRVKLYNYEASSPTDPANSTVTIPLETGTVNDSFSIGSEIQRYNVEIFMEEFEGTQDKQPNVDSFSLDLDISESSERGISDSDMRKIVILVWAFGILMFVVGIYKAIKLRSEL